MSQKTTHDEFPAVAGRRWSIFGYDALIRKMSDFPKKEEASNSSNKVARDKKTCVLMRLHSDGRAVIQTVAGVL